MSDATRDLGQLLRFRSVCHLNIGESSVGAFEIQGLFGGKIHREFLGNSNAVSTTSKPLNRLITSHSNNFLTMSNLRVKVLSPSTVS